MKEQEDKKKEIKVFYRGAYRGVEETLHWLVEEVYRLKIQVKELKKKEGK